MLSLQAAATIANTSKRTLWRRVTTGGWQLAPLRSQRRSMVALADVKPFACLSLVDAEWDLLVQADQGNPNAQCDMGLLFLEAGKPTSARYWLEQAAKQRHADALCWLAHLGFASASAQHALPEQALAQLTQAASLGHPIAKAQLHRLLTV